MQAKSAVAASRLTEEQRKGFEEGRKACAPVIPSGDTCGDGTNGDKIPTKLAVPHKTYGAFNTEVPYLVGDYEPDCTGPEPMTKGYQSDCDNPAPSNVDPDGNGQRNVALMVLHTNEADFCGGNNLFKSTADAKSDNFHVDCDGFTRQMVPTKSHIPGHALCENGRSIGVHISGYASAAEHGPGGRTCKGLGWKDEVYSSVGLTVAWACREFQNQSCTDSDPLGSTGMCCDSRAQFDRHVISHEEVSKRYLSSYGSNTRGDPGPKFDYERLWCYVHWYLTGKQGTKTSPCHDLWGVAGAFMRR